MTKADLAEKLQIMTGLRRQDSMSMLETVLNIMKESLAIGETVKIPGFGSFQVNRKAPRRGYNPQTGESITIAARRVLVFRSSPVLRKAINNGTGSLP